MIFFSPLISSIQLQITKKKHRITATGLNSLTLANVNRHRFKSNTLTHTQKEHTSQHRLTHVNQRAD